MEREFFQFLSYRWDVTRAKEIADHLPVKIMDPRPWFSWLTAVRIDEDHVTSVDVSRPLIAVRIREADGDAMIIDGWHRIARARRDGLEELPVVLLDEAQEREVRVCGGEKGLGDHG
jgi:hypothetical protein